MNAGIIYHSESRGDVRLGDMATPWLINAWRKERRRADGDSDIVGFMAEELRSRGCTYDADAGQWDIPKEPA